MRKLINTCLVLSLGNIFVTMSSEAQAQDGSWRGGARGTAAQAIGQRWKVGVSEANLYSGPSVAYSQQGRVYEGEELTILEVTRSQEWAQVSAPSGARISKVSELSRPQDQIAQDPGRFRRQTEYQYDAQGRRINLNGQMAGSGQGTGINQDTESDQAETSRFERSQNRRQEQGYNEQYASNSSPSQFNEQARRAAFGKKNARSLFKVSLPFGLSQFTRRFTSNVGTAPLSGLKSQVISPAVGTVLQSDFNDYVGLNARFSTTLAGEAPLPSIPALPEVETVNLKTNQLLGELAFDVGTPLELGISDEFWLGAQLGAQYYQVSYTPVQYPAPSEKMAPLQTHSYLSALLGAKTKFVWQSFSWHLSGGVALPLSFEQSPNSEGQWKSLGAWARTQVEYELSSNLALGFLFNYIRIGSEYTGPAEQADYSLGKAIYYTKASGYDQNLEASLTFSYRL